MNEKIQQGIFISILLLIVICLFAIGDHFLHGLNTAWSVPEYYYRNKIPYGFLWGIVGLLAAWNVESIWLKALIVAGVISVTLQIRYFIEGYPLGFVVLFLLFHFLILYFLSEGMFRVYNHYYLLSMKKILIAIAVLAIVAVVTYFAVFNKPSAQIPTDTSYTPASVSNTQEVPVATDVSVSIKNFSFSPATLTVKSGTKVTWTNNDAAPHTVTSDSGGQLDSPTISPGQSFSYTVTGAGTINYHCAIHPSMKGKVVVGN